MRFCLLIISFLLLAGCDPGPYGSNNWGGSAPRDCRYYGTCDRYPSTYGRDSGYYRRDDDYWRDRDRYERDRYERERRDYERDRRAHEEFERDKREYERRLERERRDQERSRPQPTPAPAVRPSCPSGTSFDGKHCIVPEDKRRKGGKGTVSACPDGMWVSGDRCVGR